MFFPTCIEGLNDLMVSESQKFTDEEFNQEATAKPDGIAMLRNAHINKKEEYVSAVVEGVIMDTEGKRLSFRIPKDTESFTYERRQ